MKGKLIVIEGTDGSGKGTQTILAVTALTQQGYPVISIEFPQYGNPSAAMVEEYLNGRLGTLSEISPKQASLLYAIDRFGKKKDLLQWLKEGKIVICNRYVTANMGHQAGKISNVSERKKFLAWVQELEYDILGLPKPDAVLFLQMKPEIGQRLVDKKEKRAYLDNKKKDIHEADINHLVNAFNAYSDVAQQEKWHCVACDNGKEPYSKEQIHTAIMTIIKKIISTE